MQTSCLVSSQDKEMKQLFNVLEHNSVRIAKINLSTYIHEPNNKQRHKTMHVNAPETKPLLKRLSKLSYNYGLVSFDFNGKIPPSLKDIITQRLQKRFPQDSSLHYVSSANFYAVYEARILQWKKVFENLHNHSLRCIPNVKLGGVHAQWLYHLGNQFAPDNKYRKAGPAVNLPLTIIKTVRTKRGKTEENMFVTPSYSEHRGDSLTLGLDDVLEYLFRAIKEAHQESKVPYPLEFIHIGCDEPSYFGNILLSGCSSHITGRIKTAGITNIQEITKKSFLHSLNADSLYLARYQQEHKTSLSKAFQTLYSQHLYRRVTQIKKYIHPYTKVIIWGDPFDPQKTGRKQLAYKHNTTEKIQLSPLDGLGLADLPSLTEKESTLVKKNLIIMPWHYTTKTQFKEKYIPFTTMKYLSKRGFRMIWAHEMVYKDNEVYKHKNREILRRRYTEDSYKIGDLVIGYMAVPWTRYNKTPHNSRCHLTYEYLSPNFSTLSKEYLRSQRFYGNNESKSENMRNFRIDGRNPTLPASDWWRKGEPYIWTQSNDY